MATDGPTPPPCDPDFFKNATLFLVVGEYKGGSCFIEEWCKKVAAKSGQNVDWSFFGGRARFAVLGDKQKAVEAAQELLPELETDGYHRFY